MGDLYALGGLAVAHDVVPQLERDLEAICRAVGFPNRTDEFKWSPSKGTWMYSGLVGRAREAFFLSVIGALASAKAELTICMVDATRRSANPGAEPEVDVTRLFIERADTRLRSRGRYGVIIADRPGGGRREEDEFIAGCAELLETGTAYVKPERIAINVLTTDSRMVRLLQASDLAVGCSLAFIAGESRRSPRIFADLLPLYYVDSGRRGGVSAKLHPDFNFMNLYHWLFGDDTIWKRAVGVTAPVKGFPYFDNPDDP